MTAAPEKTPARSRLRTFLPWIVGVAIVVAIVLRVPVAAFRDAIQHGPHLQLAIVDALVVLVVLATDTLATWAAVAAIGVRWAFRKVFAVRGATYLLSLLNYAAGQGGIGYYLHREGISGARAIGSTLFIMGTTFATLLLVAAATLASGRVSDPRWTWTVLGLCAAFVVYLVIIALRPALLARREVFRPLFDAGLDGHARTMIARLPHVAMIVAGHWFAFVAWDIDVPFWEAMTVMPLIVVVATLPISPAGLGTTQAAFVFFFARYADGATPEAREAHLLAFGIVHFVYGIVWQFLVGLACLPLARREATPPPT